MSTKNHNFEREVLDFIFIERGDEFLDFSRAVCVHARIEFET